MSNDLYMEDVIAISLRAMKEIEDGLKQFGITLTNKQEDDIYVPMIEKLEGLSNGDYRSQN